MSIAQEEEEILKKTATLDIEEEKIREVLSRVHRKTEKEMKGAYELLKETLHFFVQNSYSIWKTKKELKKVSSKQDRVLAQITQIMYSYNLTVDLETGSYTLITGTGMERTVEMMEKAEAGYYDLILMDIQMPNMDGYKAARIIRKFSDPEKAGITIVAMTANAFDEDKKNAYEAGMNWHIAKPIKIDELICALREIIK